MLLGNKPQLLNGMETYCTLLKGFVATGMLYVPKAFVDGGWLFSSVCMAVAAMLTAHCGLLILDARRKGRAKSYSDLALITLGPSGKAMVDIMIAVSQIGFTVAYIYFIVENITPIIFSAQTATLLNEKIITSDGNTTTVT